MAQGHIVKIVKHRGVHVVGASHGNFFRIRPGSPGDKLVGHQHISLLLMDLQGLHRFPQGLCVGADLLLRKIPAHMGRLQERQQINIHRAVCILQDHRFHLSAVHRRQMNAASLHEPPPEGQPLRGIVIAADDKNLQFPGGQFPEKPVKKLHRLPGGYGFIVDIPGQQHCLGLFFVYDPQDFLQNEGLVLQHRKFVDPLSQVQVGEMNQFHGASLYDRIKKSPDHRRLK